MKGKVFGIYGKVFFYTIAILIFAICVTALFFANQIGSVVERVQQKQLAGTFSPLLDGLKGKSDEEAAKLATAFHSKNSSFAFSLSSNDGDILYQTDNFEQAHINEDLLNTSDIASQDNQNSPERGLYKYILGGNANGRLQLVMVTDSGGRLYITGDLYCSDIYVEYIEKTAVALSLMLLVCIVGAALFARQIAKPIHKIVDCKIACFYG